jgi:formate dehydrogenase subunit delta
MNIDLLIKMTNEIGEFFAGTGDQAEAAQAVANHLRRYWEPRMRAQMLSYYEQRQGAGLTDLARNAVALLYAAAKSAPSAAATPSVTPAASPAASAPAAAPSKGAGA